jgi:hypothetical protein
MRNLGISLIAFLVLAINSNVIAQWTEVPIPSNNTLNSVDIHESGVCYAAGIDMIKSDDFGLTWEEIIFTGPLALYFESVVVYGIDIVNDSAIVAVGWHTFDNEPVVIRTQDNGLSWTLQWSGTAGSGDKLRDVEFFDESFGIATGDDRVLKTTDGGITWSTVWSGAYQINSVTFVSSTVVVAVGNNVILRSTNGGASFLTLFNAGKLFRSIDYDPGANKLQSVYFLTSNNSSYASNSYDAGLSWDNFLLTDDLIHCNELLSNDTVYYGYESSFRVSFNNGLNDFNITDYPFAHVYDVTFKDGHGLAVAGILSDSKVYYYDNSLSPNLQQNVDFLYASEICFDDSTAHIPTHLTLDSYEWLVNGVSVSTDTLFNFAYPAPGTYQVDLVTAYNGNMDTVTKMIPVIGAPVVSPFTVSANPALCVGNSYNFTVVNIAGQTGFMVLKEGVPINFSSASGNNRTYNLGPVLVSTSFEIIKWEISACDSVALTQTFVLTAESYPSASQFFYVQDSLVCHGNTTQIVVPSPNGGYSYILKKNNVWVDTVVAPFGDTLFIPTPPITGPTQFKLKVVSPLAGCDEDLTTIDSVHVDPVSANFSIGNGYFAVNHPLVIDTSNVIGGNFDWYVSGTPSVFNNTNSLNPTIEFDTNDFYTIQLVAESEYVGCKDSLTEMLVIFLDTLQSTSKEICWAKEIEFPQVVLDKHLDQAGNLIVVGYSKYDFSGGTYTKYSGVIQKYDNDANLIWEWHDTTAEYSDSYHSTQFSSIENDNQGNIYVTGVFYGKQFQFREIQLYNSSGSNYRIPFLMKLDEDGQFVWWVRKETTGTAFQGGFSDVVFDDSTNTLFAACPNLSGTVEFTGGWTSFPSPSRFRVIELNMNGNYLRNFPTDAYLCSNLQPTSSSGTSQDAVVSPKIFMGKNHELYILGEYNHYQDQTFGDFVLPAANTQYRMSFVAKLKIDGPISDQGWIDAGVTSEFDSGDAWHEPFMSHAMDSLDNIYQSLNWNNFNHPTIVNSDTLEAITGTFGSTIIKFDSDLNYVWHKNFEPSRIHHIYCGNSEDIYFVGRSINNQNFAHFQDSLPLYLVPQSGNDMILGSMTVDGELTWLDKIGDGEIHFSDPITGNVCGDVYFSGRCGQHFYALDLQMPFDFELNDSVYGNFTGQYVFKLTDSLCTSGGCLNLFCSDTANFEVPVLTWTNNTITVTGNYDYYQWTQNGYIIPGSNGPVHNYSTNGNYTVFVSSSNGCNALLSPDSSCLNQGYAIVPSIHQIISGLETYSTGPYQWYLNGSPISGAANQQYYYSQNGSYTVQATDENGCTVLSAPFIVTEVGLESSGLANSISIYPNPTHSSSYIYFDFVPTDLKFDLFDLSGKICDAAAFESVSESIVLLDLTNLTSGVYFLRVQENDLEIYLKIVKAE